MIESFLITSRETLEASLVVGIVLAYLGKTHNEQYKRSVWLAVAAGILSSILVAVLFTVVAGGFEGRAEEIFEGTTMLIGAALLTSMILWMARQRHIAKEIEHDVEARLHRKDAFTSHLGIFSLVFVAIIREGVETVIFLNAIKYANGVSLISGMLGVAVAIGAGYLFFTSFRRVNLKQVFTVSSVLLIFFAAGLIAHGIHEFEEAGVVDGIVSPLFDINPAAHADGSFPALHEKGVVGSFLVGLFGYNGNPSLLEVAAYILYLSFALGFLLLPELRGARAKAQA